MVKPRSRWKINDDHVAKLCHTDPAELIQIGEIAEWQRCPLFLRRAPPACVGGGGAGYLSSPVPVKGVRRCLRFGPVGSGAVRLAGVTMMEGDGGGRPLHQNP